MVLPLLNLCKYIDHYWTILKMVLVSVVSSILTEQ